MTDSERFYNTVVDFFEDVEERVEVNELLVWWNRYAHTLLALGFMLRIVLCRQIFPAYSSARPAISKDSALAKLKAKRLALRALGASDT